MRQDELLFILNKLGKGISELLGSACEVVITDINKPDNAVLSIYNGHVTDRRIGDPLSKMGRELTKNGSADDYINYRAKTKDGRLLKCATIQFKFDDTFLAFGLNIDITNLEMAKMTLDHLLHLNPDMVDSYGGDLGNPDNLLKESILKAIESVGKTPPLMNKEDRIKAVKYLSNAGVLKIQNSVNKIAEALNISRYTVYNYLRVIADEDI